MKHTYGVQIKTRAGGPPEVRKIDNLDESNFFHTHCVEIEDISSGVALTDCGRTAREGVNQLPSSASGPREVRQLGPFDSRKFLRGVFIISLASHFRSLS